MKDKLLVLLIVVFAVLSFIAIGFADTTLVPRSIPSLIAWIRYFVALFAFILIVTKGNVKMTKPMTFRVMVIGITSLLTVFYHYKGTLDFLTIVGVIPLLIFCFANDDHYLKAFVLFRKLMVVIAALSVIAYLDFLVFHALPSTTVPYYGREGLYVNYYFSYLTIGEDGIRACGLFNEPGYLGTILALLIIADKLNFKRVGNIIMILAGITAMSMAFWALLLIGLFLHKLKTWRTRFIAILLAVSFFTIVNTVEFSDPFISAFVERFQYDPSTGSFKGNNRKTVEFDQVYERFEKSQNVLLGYGSGYYASLEMEGVAIYKSAILDWGYLGFFLTYGLLVFGSLLLAKNNRDALIFVLCFIASIYQRPNVFTFVYILVLFGGIRFLINEKRHFQVI